MKSDDNSSQAPNASASVDRDLLRIMVFSTVLGFGTLAAFLCSLRDIENDVSFVFSARTVIGFAGGAAAGLLFWLFIKRKMKAEQLRPPPPTGG